MNVNSQQTHCLDLSLPSWKVWNTGTCPPRSCGSNCSKERMWVRQKRDFWIMTDVLFHTVLEDLFWKSLVFERLRQVENGLDCETLNIWGEPLRDEHWKIFSCTGHPKQHLNSRKDLIVTKYHAKWHLHGNSTDSGDIGFVRWFFVNEVHKGVRAAKDVWSWFWSYYL